MDFVKLNKSRHAVKHWDGKKLATVDVKQIISSAVLAPSAHNIQPWLFVIAESDKAREGLVAEAKSRNKDQIMQAGAVVTLFSDTDLAARSQEIAALGRGEIPEEKLDRFMSRYPAMFEGYSQGYMSDYLALNAGLVAMNMLFAIKDRGYEGNAILGFEKTPRINEILNIPLRYRPELIIVFGNSDEKGEPHFGLPAEKFYEIR